MEPNVSLTTVEGHTATLPCHTLPDPTLTFTWFFNGNQIVLPSNEENGPSLLSNGSLFYPVVSQSLEGGYMCVARNGLGTAQGTVQLTVFGELEQIHLVSQLQCVVDMEGWRKKRAKRINDEWEGGGNWG